MNKLFNLVCSMILCALGLSACNNDNINTSTVAELNLTRFAGQWYEVARFDHSFERGLVGCMATYTINDDGTIKVLNTGYKGSLDGKYNEAVGKARRPNDAEPGKLEVAFFWNFYSPYYVMELAEDYRYALIGSKKSKYLWILSRTPKLNGADMDYLLKSAQNRGYNTNELIWVEQKVE